MAQPAYKLPIGPAAPEVVPAPEPEVLTLLDLVRVVAEYAETEEEVVATIQHLLHSGQVKLVGLFLGPDVEDPVN